MDPLDGLIAHDYNPLKTLLRDILDQLKRATGRIDTLEKLVATKETLIKELQDQMSQVRGSGKEMEKSLSSLCTAHTTLSDHVADIDSTLADMRFLHGLPEQISTMGQDLTSQIKKLNERVDKQTYQGQLDGLDKLESRMSIVEDRTQKNSKGIDSCSDSIDAVNKKVTTNKFNIEGLQTSVKSIESILPTKADRSELSSKADKSSVTQLSDHLQQQQERTSAIEDSLKKLRDLVDKLQQQVNGEEQKLGQLWDRTMCGACRSTKPSVHCRECDKNLCDSCDHSIHEDDDRRLHIRTPLYGKNNNNNNIRDTNQDEKTTFSRQKSTTKDGAGGRVIEYVSGDTDALRKWCEAQFADVWGKDKALRAEISELFGKDRDLRAKLADLLKSEHMRDDQHAALLDQFRALERDIAAKINNSGFATHQYVDQQDSDLLKEIRLLEKAMGKAMKTELKRFERDIVVFLEDSRTEHNETSAGRIHFRCLTCDNPSTSQPGPATLGFTRAVGAPAQINAGTTSMAIERGEDLWIHGKDGHVYKGRGDTTVTVTPGDPGRMSHFNVSYNEKGKRPASASAAQRPDSRDRNSRSPSRGSSRVHHSLNGVIEEKTAELPDVTMRPGSAAAASRTRTFAKTQVNTLMSPAQQQTQPQQPQPTT